MNAYKRLKLFFRTWHTDYFTRGQIANELGIPWSTVNRNIGKLVAEGHVRLTLNGNEKVYTANWRR